MQFVEKFIPPYLLTTPVLFLIFKRLDTTKQVFEAIKQAKPPRLYIAADGPRAHIEGEEEKVKAVREYVLSSIDWDCEVKTLFRETNLGCGKAVSEAITWFFENEEKGIILEDDTLPSQSFFWFCEELLKRYIENKQIAMISGNNFQDGQIRGDGDYYFSVYTHIWGWATWRDRWLGYDFYMRNLDFDKIIDGVLYDKIEIQYWRRIFNLMKQQKIDTWDYQWLFYTWSKKQLTVLPNANLVQNIGFGTEATRTKDYIKELIIKPKEIDIIRLRHPSRIVRNLEADAYSFKRIFMPKPLYIRVYRKIKRFVKELYKWN